MIELGAGVGVVGMVSAALGADAVITDLAPVAADMIAPNVARNAASATPPSHEEDGWTCVGAGRARAHALDWYKPLAAQPLADGSPLACDVVLAADTVWLKSLIEPFAGTVAALLGAPGSAAEAYLAFQERAQPGSQTFAHPDELVAALAARGCTVVPCPVDTAAFAGRMKAADKTMRCFHVRRAHEAKEK